VAQQGLGKGGVSGITRTLNNLSLPTAFVGISKSRRILGASGTRLHFWQRPALDFVAPDPRPAAYNVYILDYFW
jgi:hypothetical protein